jgi:hypothetical protein
MGNLQSVTDLTRLAQDVQYTTALRGMNEAEKQQYFASQKQELIGDILNDREATFQKTFTDATRNSAIQGSLFYYLQRNRDLDAMGTVIKNKNEAEIGTQKYNNQLALRQYEINEWSYNNKMDTLFVFQVLFITLMLAAGLVYLNGAGFLSQTIVGILVGILLVIDIVILISRVRYTNKTRDKRYWNKRRFPTKALPQDSGSICPPGQVEVDSQPAQAPPPVL